MYDTQACYRFHVPVQKIHQSLFAYMYVAHTAFCVYVWHGNGLHMCTSIVQNTNLWMLATISWRFFAHFCTRKHAAYVDLAHTCKCFSAGISDAYATPSLLTRLFPCCKGRRNIYFRSCHSGTVGSATIVTDTHTSLFRHACMLILIRKRNTQAYLKRWWNLFYFDGRHL